MVQPVSNPDAAAGGVAGSLMVVTGGAGFIGSNLQARLSGRGFDTVVIDRLGDDGRWRNLARHPPAEIVDPADLDRFLARAGRVGMVFHLGAVSDTTCRDADHAWATNVALSERLLDWCAATGTRFVYASSAATYGDGSRGFDEACADLAPLNLYGWTKHVFDRKVAQRIARGAAMPPQCAGLKFFNVYGPNEYHKGHMVSVVKRKFDELAAGSAATLFRSDRADLADGAQARDFVHVDDVVEMMLFLLDHPAVSGLFNAGTGIARTYLDLAHAVCDAMGTERRVRFVDMPASLAGQYQSFTRAPMDRLRRAGYVRAPIRLEDGIASYVRDHLATPDPYR